MVKVNKFHDHLDIALPSGKSISVWKLDPNTGARHYVRYDCSDIAQMQFRPPDNALKGKKLDWVGYSDVISNEYEFRIIACQDTVMEYNLYWV